MKSKTATCATCRNAEKRKYHEQYECRVHAPIGQVIQINLPGYAAPESKPTWPLMKKDDWCNEYKKMTEWEITRRAQVGSQKLNTQ